MGPAHYGVCRYALGHDQIGGLPAVGKELIQEMDRLGMILDVTHLSDGCFWDALENDDNHVIAISNHSSVCVCAIASDLLRAISAILHLNDVDVVCCPRHSAQTCKSWCAEGMSSYTVISS